MKEGMGIMGYRNGDLLKGEWKNDKKEGQGVITPDGLCGWRKI